MSITDELRRYVKDHTNWDVALTTYPPQRTMTYHEGAMDAIADRIDAENERECHEQYVCGAEHGIGASIEASMIQERGYIELPKDADGEPIHIGDTVEWVPYDNTYPSVVREVDAVGNGVFFAWDKANGRFARYEAYAYRHHKQPTVEGVLMEFVDEFNRDDTELCDEEIIERFAAKLRLAESEES